MILIELNETIITETLFSIKFNYTKRGKKEIEKYCICSYNNQYHIYIQFNQRIHYKNKFKINNIIPEIKADKYALNILDDYLQQDNYHAYPDNFKLKIEEKVMKKISQIKASNIISR